MTPVAARLARSNTRHPRRLRRLLEAQDTSESKLGRGAAADRDAGLRASAASRLRTQPHRPATSRRAGRASVTKGFADED